MLAEYAPNNSDGRETNTYQQRLDIADYFLSTRSGPFLDPEILGVVIRDMSKTLHIRWYGEDALNHIIIHDNESIYHLCLPKDATYALGRAGLNNIRDLASFLLTGVWKGKDTIRMFGPKSKKISKERLTLFYRELAKVFEEM